MPTIWISTVYDAAGNLTNWNNVVYVYNAFNQMIRMTSGSEDWGYAYTADDERIWMYNIAANTSRWTLRDLNGKVLREYLSNTGAWSVGTDYVYRDGFLLAAETQTGPRHFHLDQNRRMNRRKRRKAPKDLFASALRLSRGSDLESAARSLIFLAAEYPEDLDVRFATASVLLRLDRYAEAVPHFEQFIATFPKHEWASLGLFHSLWKLDRHRDALREIKRFADSGGESMEYRRLERDLIKAIKNLDAPGLPEEDE